MSNVAQEARDYHGRWTEGGSAPRVPEKSPSAKALLAMNFYKKANKKEQRYAEKQEAIFAKAIGAVQTDNGNPVDNTKTIGDIEHGIEIKTLVSGKNSKVTMNADAIINKVRWNKDPHRTIHTVALDKRDKFAGGENKELFSGHTIYYKRGVGSFNLSAMYKAKDPAEAMRLMTMPWRDLPPKARGPKR